MSTYLLALFLHLSAVVAAFCAVAIIHHGVLRLYRAGTVAQAREAAGLVGWVGPRMPLFALALFLTGAWLVTQQWRWNAPWVDAGITGLVLLIAVGGGFLRPKLNAIQALLAQGDGPVPDAVTAALRERGLWIGVSVQPFIAAAVMFDMVMKPELGWALAFIAMAMVLGAMTPMPRGKAAVAQKRGA